MSLLKAWSRVQTMKLNKHYDHVFVIMRADLFQGADTPFEEKITVTKILWDGELADREVARLNQLHAAGDVRYFSQVARLERKGHAGPSIAPPIRAPKSETQRPSRLVGDIGQELHPPRPPRVASERPLAVIVMER
jgi:hypothetical protein